MSFTLLKIEVGRKGKMLYKQFDHDSVAFLIIAIIENVLFYACYHSSIKVVSENSIQSVTVYKSSVFQTNHSVEIFQNFCEDSQIFLKLSLLYQTSVCFIEFCF